MARIEDQLRRFLEQLEFARDVRQPPDDARRRQFYRGWQRAMTGPAYSRRTLSLLTWNNLGYRVGVEFGPVPVEGMDEAFENLSRIFVIDGPLPSGGFQGR